MSLTIIHSFITKSFAGSERHALELANYQAAQGHDVHLFLRFNSHIFHHPDADCYPLPSVKIHRMPKHGTTPFMWWHTRRIKADIIHAHYGHDAKILPRIAPKGTPVVATLHQSAYLPKFACTDGLICINNTQPTTVPENYAGKITRIDNWIAARKAPTKKRLADLRKELNIPSDALVFGSIGRLVKSKNPVMLVHAFLSAKMPDSHLIMVGDGSQSLNTRLAAANNKNVHFPGHVSNAADYMHLCDVFVFPSQHETFGLVLLEAMQAKKPIVAFAIENVREIFGNYPIHWVEEQSTEALAAALQNISAGDIEYDISDFSLPKKAEQVMGFYHALLSP